MDPSASFPFQFGANSPFGGPQTYLDRLMLRIEGRFQLLAVLNRQQSRPICDHHRTLDMVADPDNPQCSNSGYLCLQDGHAQMMRCKGHNKVGKCFFLLASVWDTLSVLARRGTFVSVGNTLVMLGEG